MTHSRLLLAAGIIALVIGISFMFSVPRTARDTVQKPVASAPAAPAVTVRDIYKKGVHTLTGSLQAPNACTTVMAEAARMGDDASSTESIQLSLSMPTDTAVCLQLPTSVSFSTVVTAPANLPITATVNGTVASTTVL